jgi:gamma-glutamyl-gamma-aminobutyrate hydrolase PuuD
VGKATNPASARERRRLSKLTPAETVALVNEVMETPVPPDVAATGNYTQTSLELLYGKRGVPETDPVKMMNATIEKNLQPVNSHRVAVIKDHLLDFPELFLDVFIAGDRYEEAAFASMLSRARCTRAKSVLEADLVIFTGGADVEPALYGATPHKSTKSSQRRDTEDIGLYLMCYEAGIPMLGVCRGAQFLHVMNGGKLYQDVDNHYGDHAIFDRRENRVIAKISSVHHQMVVPYTEGGMEIIATSQGKSQKRYLDDINVERGSANDIEAFFYRDTCCIGVQGHPEYANYNLYTKWCLELLNHYIVCNPDITFDQPKGARPNRRLDPSIIAERATKTSPGNYLLKGDTN